jgi:hypothetical protein
MTNYKLEYSYEQNAFHILCPNESRIGNGYCIVFEHCQIAKLDRVVDVVRSIYEHPTVDEIKQVIIGLRSVNSI